VKVYDREGNVIEVQDYNGRALNEQIQYAKVLEKKNAQFRLTPVTWWLGWGGVILGWTLTLVLFVLGCIGILVGSAGLAWAGGVMGLVLGAATFFPMVGLIEYHKRHGMPKKLVDKPKEMYCKKCQKQLEDELEVGKQQRAQELLTELASLGVSAVPALSAAPEPSDEEDEKEDHVWTPPPDDPFSRKRR
jgi:hypothetical protein